MKITSNIINAIMKELKYLFLDQAGTVILDTNLKDDATYDFPLCIFELPDAPESARLPGNGRTRIDFDFSLRIYVYEPNAYNEDDGGYAVTLLDIIDTIREYFENETWATQEMVDLTTNFGFRLTFGGINKAESIQVEDKTVMGYRIAFNTIAYDTATDSTYNITATAITETGTIVFD